MTAKIWIIGETVPVEVETRPETIDWWCTTKLVHLDGLYVPFTSVRKIETHV